MPIITLQRRQVEVGRIRIGELVPTQNGTGKRPSKRSSFLFTTESEKLAEQIAALYPGKVEPWEPNGGGPKQFKVDTGAKSLAVIVPPNSVSQWYELWSGGGCQRRCDGQTNVLKDEPCLCPADPAERAALAGNGQACKPTTRINVMLAEARGAGVWRLETHGYYAATELPAMAELLAMGGGYTEGRLELQERSAMRPKTRGTGMERRVWMVPVLHVDATPQTILEGRAQMAIGNVREQQGETQPAVGGQLDRPALPAAAAAEVPEAPKMTSADWIAEIAKTGNAGDLDALMGRMKTAGVKDVKVVEAWKARAEELRPKPVAAEPAIEADADEPDVETVWAAIATAAGERNWKMSDLEKRILDRLSKPSDECNGWQLTEFLTALNKGEVA